MNILDKTNRANAPHFGTEKSMAKRDKYSWANPSEMGEFMMLAKESLNIDGSYQRPQTSEARVRVIAKEWDWKLFGVISVIRRPDGSFWVYDGGHRTRAAFYRDDIPSIPCMVFNASETKEEAKAFVGSNLMKSTVSAFHRHKASVLAEEPLAMAAQAIVEKHGYKPNETGKTRGTFAAINTLMAMVKESPLVAERTFSACSQIASDQEPIPGTVLGGLFRCQQKIGSGIDILTGDYINKLISVGIKGIEAAIRREKHIVGKGGELVEAKAILDILNKGKKHRILFL